MQLAHVVLQFNVDGNWHTWIDCEKFHELVSSPAWYLNFFVSVIPLAHFSHILIYHLAGMFGSAKVYQNVKSK